MEKLYGYITIATETNLTPVAAAQEQSYISANTWTRIEEREAKRKNKEDEHVKELSKQIEKEARKDKVDHAKRKLETGSEQTSPPHKLYT